MNNLVIKKTHRFVNLKIVVNWYCFASLDRESDKNDYV